MKTIITALALLEKIGEENRFREKGIALGVEGEISHAKEVLGFVMLLEPKASLELQLSALFHDVDRLVTEGKGGSFMGSRSGKAYERHKKSHAARSAGFIIPRLGGMVGPRSLRRIRFLILHHDDPGREIEAISDRELDLLAAGDCLAFFTTVAPNMIRREGIARTIEKIRFMIRKAPAPIRTKLLDWKLENDVINRLKDDAIRDYFRSNNPELKRQKYCPACKSLLARKRRDGEKVLGCRKCDYIFWNNPKPVASAAIVRYGRVLLVRRAQAPLRGYWCLPGGFIRYGETPEEAATREVSEETGLRLRIRKVLCVNQIDNDPRGVHIDIIYLAAARGKLTLGPESSEHGYFGERDLPNKMAYRHRDAAILAFRETWGQ